MAVNNADDEDFGLSDLARIAEQSKREPSSFKELRMRAQKHKIAINSALELHEQRGYLNDPENLKQFRRHTWSQEALQERMASYKEAQRERWNTQAVNTIGRTYSDTSMGSYVSANINSAGVQAAGLQAAGNQSFGDLAQRRQALMAEVGTLRQSSINAAGEYVQGRGINTNADKTLQDNSKRMQEIAKELTVATAGMQYLKDQGQDPASRMRDLNKQGMKAANIIGYNNLEDQMQKGEGLGALSGTELKKKETEAAQKLIKALDELRNSAGKTEKELEKLTGNAEKAAEDLQEISDARSMAGGGGNGARQTAMWASAAAQLSNIVGNTIQTMGVNQPMQQMSNIAGYANIENQKYDMWRSAVGGNMTDRLNLGGWADAAKFGKSLANWQGAAVGSRIVGGVATGVMGGAQVVEAVGSAGVGVAGRLIGKDDTTQHVIQGGLAMAEGVSGTLIAGNDALKKLSTSQTEIEANMAAMNTTKALTHVTGAQLQEYRDYLMGLNAAGGQLGRRAGAFVDTAGSADFMTRMQTVGVGPEEFANLSQYGAANMGSMFSADQAIRATHYENMGFGSAQENMQRMAALSAGGLQNPAAAMDKILERAVATGINSSKALNIIAENTGQMVEQATGRGTALDTADAISSLIFKGIDRDNPNKEFAVKQAAQVFQSEEAIKNNTSSSFPGQIAVARLQRDLGLSSTAAIAMQGVSTTIWQNWRNQFANGKLSKDALQLEMMNQGVDVSKSTMFQSDPNKFFDKLASDKVLTQIERAGVGFGTGANKDFGRLKSWVEEDKTGQRLKMFTGKTLPQDAPSWVRDEIIHINESIKLHDPTADSRAVRQQMAVGLGWIGDQKGALLKEGEYYGDAFGLSQMEKQGGARRRVGTAQQGLRTLGGEHATGTTGAMAVDATRRVAEAQAGSNPEAEFAQAAAKSAADFGKSAHTLDRASGKLVEAANALLASSGAKKVSGGDEVVAKVKDEMKKAMPAPLQKLTSKVDGTH